MVLPALQPSSGWHAGHLTAPLGNWMLGVVDQSSASAVAKFPHPDIHVLSLLNKKVILLRQQEEFLPVETVQLFPQG